MSRTSAERRLAKGNLTNLYAGNAEFGWRIIKQVPIVQGKRKVAQGKWALLRFEDGGLAGFLIREGPGPSSPVGQFPGWSPSAITAKESKISAGLYGASQTEGLTQWLNRQRGLNSDS